MGEYVPADAELALVDVVNLLGVAVLMPAAGVGGVGFALGVGTGLPAPPAAAAAALPVNEQAMQLLRQPFPYTIHAAHVRTSNITGRDFDFSNINSIQFPGF